MKSLPLLSALSLTLLSVSPPVIGQEGMQRLKDFANMQSQGQGEMQRSYLRRNEAASSEGKSEQSGPREPTTNRRPDDLKPVPGLVPVQGRERLSPEERKQLRRDIHAAGRDIYRRPRAD